MERKTCQLKYKMAESLGCCILQTLQNKFLNEKAAFQQPEHSVGKSADDRNFASWNVCSQAPEGISGMVLYLAGMPAVTGSTYMCIASD